MISGLSESGLFLSWDIAFTQQFPLCKVLHVNPLILALQQPQEAGRCYPPLPGRRMRLEELRWSTQVTIAPGGTRTEHSSLQPESILLPLLLINLHIGFLNAHAFLRNFCICSCSCLFASFKTEVIFTWQLKFLYEPLKNIQHPFKTCLTPCNFTNKYIYRNC